MFFYEDFAAGLWSDSGLAWFIPERKDLVQTIDVIGLVVGLLEQDGP